MTDSRLSAALSDRYRVERELGAGGMATVYLAHDLRHDRDVAIKVLHPDLAATLGAERFLAEIKTTAKLQHPHILPLLDSGSADGLLYYVMPYVAGESLRDRLHREKQLPIEDAVRIAREVADALGHAHGHGIIHRDIKPENILLQEGHALVADFGIALAVSAAGGQRMTQTGLSLGTPQYMSPEQAMGEKALDARADIYALGAVTYEMLTGEPPFTGATAQAVVARKLAEAPPSVCVVRSAAGPALDQVVRRALAPLAADRFDSIASFSTAIGEASRESGAHLVTTPRPQPTASLAPPAGVQKARRWQVAAGVAVVGALVAAAAFWPRGRTGSDAALLRVTIPTEPLALFGHGKAPVVAISPDGRTLAYVAGKGSEGQLMLRRLDAATATPVPDAAAVFGPFFSPDGVWLGYVDASEGLNRARLKKRHLTDGTVFDLADGRGLHGAAWTRDGRIVLGGAAATDWTISIIPEDGGTPDILVRRDSLKGEGFLVWPSLTPDEQHVVFAALAGNGTPLSLDLLDLESRERRRLWETRDALAGGGSVAITTDGVMIFAADGAIFGAELDERRGRLRADPVKLVPDILMGLWQEPGLGHFALGRDGTLVYVAGDRGKLSETVVIRWDDSSRATPFLRARAPASEGGTALATFGLRLVPGSDRIVFTDRSQARNLDWVRWYESSDFWEAGPGEGTARRLAPPRSYNPVPSWDGEWIFTNRVPAERFTSAIFRQRRQGSDVLEQLTEDRAGILASPYSVARDGSLLFYIETDTLTPPAASDIYALAPDGDRAPQPVLVEPEIDAHPAISPDGRWLAWTSGSRERQAVFIAPFPAMTPRLRVSAGVSSMPAWSHDGSTLYYFDGARRRVVGVAFTGGAAPRFGQPRSLTGVFSPGSNVRQRPFDVDEQGRVYTVSASVPDSLAVHDFAVYANWGTTLRAAVRRRGP